MQFSVISLPRISIAPVHYSFEDLIQLQDLIHLRDIIRSQWGQWGRKILKTHLSVRKIGLLFT